MTTYDITEGRYIVTKEELEFQIASEERFIAKQRGKMDRMRSLEAGVRSSTISTDLAMFEISISNAEDRIAKYKKKLSEGENYD